MVNLAEDEFVLEITDCYWHYALYSQESLVIVRYCRLCKRKITAQRKWPLSVLQTEGFI